MYLGSHDPLSLGDEVAPGTRAVAVAAVALVSFQPRHQSVVAAARTLGTADLRDGSDDCRRLAVRHITSSTRPTRRQHRRT